MYKRRDYYMYARVNTTPIIAVANGPRNNNIARNHPNTFDANERSLFPINFK